MTVVIFLSMFSNLSKIYTSHRGKVSSRRTFLCFVMLLVSLVVDFKFCLRPFAIWKYLQLQWFHRHLAILNKSNLKVIFHSTIIISKSINYCNSKVSCIVDTNQTTLHIYSLYIPQTYYEIIIRNTVLSFQFQGGVLNKQLGQPLSL